MRAKSISKIEQTMVASLPENDNSDSDGSTIKTESSGKPITFDRRLLLRKKSSRNNNNNASSRLGSGLGETPLPNPHSKDKEERHSSRELIDGIAKAVLVAESARDISEIYSSFKANRKLVRGVLRTNDNARRRNNSYHKPKVSFTNVYLREYARTVEDNPSVSEGPPLTISWEHSETAVISVDSYERKRESQRGVSFNFLLNATKREDLLKQVWGISQAEIANAVRGSRITKNHRRTTVHRETSTVGKVIGGAARLLAGRGRLAAADKEALRLQEHQERAALQQQQLQKQEQDKRRSMRLQPRQRLSSRRLIFRDDSADSDDDEDDENELEDERYLELGYGVLSKPIEFDILMGKMKSGLFKTYPKGIIVAKEAAESSTAQNNSNSNSSNNKKKKNVSFAVNQVNKKVWNISREFQKIDQAMHGFFWWTEEDMEERYELDVGISELVEDQLGQILRGAYKSTKGCDESAFANIDTIKLDMQDMAECSIGRGLEAEVIPQVRKIIMEAHRKVVLTKQEAQRDLYEDEDFTFDDMVSAMESIRENAVKFSRPSRLVAYKIGLFDEKQAKESW